MMSGAAGNAAIDLIEQSKENIALSKKGYNAEVLSRSVSDGRAKLQTRIEKEAE